MSEHCTEIEIPLEPPDPQTWVLRRTTVIWVSNDGRPHIGLEEGLKAVTT